MAFCIRSHYSLGHSNDLERERKSDPFSAIFLADFCPVPVSLPSDYYYSTFHGAGSLSSDSCYFDFFVLACQFFFSVFDFYGISGPPCMPELLSAPFMRYYNDRTVVAVHPSLMGGCKLQKP